MELFPFPGEIEPLQDPLGQRVQLQFRREGRLVGLIQGVDLGILSQEGESLRGEEFFLKERVGINVVVTVGCFHSSVTNGEDGFLESPLKIYMLDLVQFVGSNFEFYYLKFKIDQIFHYKITKSYNLI